MTTYSVYTQHGKDRKIRKKTFHSYEEAESYAKNNNPDRDSSMIPTMDEKYASPKNYEQGFYWHGNKYAVMTKDEHPFYR